MRQENEGVLNAQAAEYETTIANLKKSHADEIAILHKKIEILEKEKEVLEKEKGNLKQAKENALIDYKHALDMQKNELDSKDRELNDLRHILNSKDRQLDVQGSLLNRQENRIEQLINQLDSDVRVLAEKEIIIEQLTNQLKFFHLDADESTLLNNSTAIAANDQSDPPSELEESFYAESISGYSDNDEFISSSSANASTHDLNANNDELVNMHAMA